MFQNIAIKGNFKKFMLFGWTCHVRNQDQKKLHERFQVLDEKYKQYLIEVKVILDPKI